MRKIVNLLGIALCFMLISTSTGFAQIDYCEGNFDCDLDVDGTDASVFKSDFGRSQFKNPCPFCYPPAQVPKTGQTTSYTIGDDGDLEKGIAWPNPRFTDNGNGTVTDNLTGLIWLKNANCFGKRTWPQALSDCNALASGACGLTDGSGAGFWRLPNRNELNSLIDVAYEYPALSNTAGIGQWTSGDPFLDVQSYYYWSSTTSSPDSPSYAWLVVVTNGVVTYNYKSDAIYVWPVRGGH